MKFRYKKEIKDIEDWLDDPFNVDLYYDQSINEINEAIENTGPHQNGADFGSPLGTLARVLGRRAILGISQGDPCGLAELRRAFEYQYWSLRILIFNWYSQGALNDRNPFTPNQIQIVLFESILNEASERIAWLSDWFRSELLGGVFREKPDGGKTGEAVHVASFSLALSQPLLDGRFTPMHRRFDFGVYQSVLDAWGDPDALSAAIYACCDYHVECMASHDRSFMQFAGPPQRLVPVEYLALRTVRTRLGLETPKPAHPLLDTPFGELPLPLPEIQDEFLDRLLAAAATRLPGLLDVP